MGATSATLRYLTAGTVYSFRVVAYGEGSTVSQPSNTIAATPFSTVPNPPVNLRFYCLDDSLLVDWDYDGWVGVPNIDANSVTQYSIDGGSTWSTMTSNTPNAPVTVEIVNFPTLIPRNTELLIRAAAVNSVGQSGWSATKAGTTSSDMVPISTFAVTRGESSATLNWSAPSGGNAQIIDYVISIREGGNLNGDLWSFQSAQRIQNNGGTTTTPTITSLAGASAQIGNLTPRKLYFFTIRAVNSGRTTNDVFPQRQEFAGFGKSQGGNQISTTPYATSLPAVPAAPTAVSGVPGVFYTMGSNEDANSVSLSWTAPSDDGGLEITGYAIQYSNGGSTWSGSNDYSDTARPLMGTELRPLNPPASTTAKVKNLVVMQPFVFRVAAINEIGTGPYSTASAAVTPTKVPLGPENLVGVPGNGSVSLSWDVRTVDAERMPVLGYNVEYSLSTSQSTPWTRFNGNTLITGTSAVVTGLANGTRYAFRVFAVNAGGQGGVSNTVGYVPG
jgi:titin